MSDNLWDLFTETYGLLKHRADIQKKVSEAIDAAAVAAVKVKEAKDAIMGAINADAGKELPTK